MTEQEPQQQYCQDSTPVMKQQPSNYVENMHKDSLYQDKGAQLMKQTNAESAGTLKCGPLDNGYETSDDQDLRAQRDLNKMMSNSLHQPMQQHSQPQLAHNQHHQQLHDQMPQHQLNHPYHPNDYPHIHHQHNLHLMQGGSMIMYDMQVPYSFEDKQQRSMLFPPKVKPKDQQMPGG